MVLLTPPLLQGLRPTASFTILASPTPGASWLHLVNFSYDADADSDPDDDDADPGDDADHYG